MSEQLAPGVTAESVLTGDLRNKVDGIWDAFWSGGEDAGLRTSKLKRGFF
ncbi:MULTISPECIES: hypothetical protein [Prochlorococcus]|nr:MULTISPECIES: hypothetical protein [Prochlorococcus]KGG11065.1 hypothetical protein EV04_1138 [Prochlorococcus marinus str. LG]KGG18446.1 hypothetical protein EV08_2031 [Prochlorococcus marinus str. SS2]KGG22639.1 hypothetical protein EV09_2019 [Prochlorococcus marinus str. SS35]KGG34438.1 hypothetical protein EV11_2024 [Prochlorococcus sp. SS52]